MTNITKKHIRYNFVSNNLIFFLKFYLMRKFSEIELSIIGIQIGCVLRLARLEQKLSQHDLALVLGYTSTMIGRIERFENATSWDKILLISRQLNINHCDLFILKNRQDLISIVDQSLNLDDKLTQEKLDYYNFLKKNILSKFELLERQKKDNKK